MLATKTFFCLLKPEKKILYGFMFPRSQILKM